MLRNIKKFGTLLIVGALVVSLSACGKPADPKKLLEDANGKLTTITKLERKMNISINLESKDIPEEGKQIVDAINSATLSVGTKIDKTQQKTETTIGAKGKFGIASIDLQIPILSDEKTKKVYIKADTIIDQFGLYFPEYSEVISKLKGKIIEVDASTENKNAKELETFFKSLTDKSQTLDKTASEKAVTLEVTKEEKAKGIEHKIKYTIEPAQIKSLINDLFTEAGKIAGGGDLEQMKTTLNGVTILPFDVISTIGKDGNFKTQELFVTFEVKSQSESGKFTLHIVNEFSNIGKDQTFSIDPVKEKDNLITDKELSKQIKL